MQVNHDNWNPYENWAKYHICHRNFSNDFAFTNSKDFLYYLARSPLSQIFTELSLHEHIFLRQRNIYRGNKDIHTVYRIACKSPVACTCTGHVLMHIRIDLSSLRKLAHAIFLVVKKLKIFSRKKNDIFLSCTKLTSIHNECVG